MSAKKNTSGISALTNLVAPTNTDKVDNEPKKVAGEPKAPDKDILPPTTPKKQEKKKSEYLRLDVTDYKDYISLMAEHTTNTSGKYVSMTQYILRLIEADKQANLETFEKLEQIERMKRELM